ncbi:MAG: CYTH domain-containing protein [Candidatus Limimorpha sp.]
MNNTAHKNQETERKFLVKDNRFMNETFRTYEIEQGYLCLQPEKTVRIRLRDDKAFLTIKGKPDANSLTRFEWEKEIDPEDARQLLQLCEGNTVRKTRHLVSSGIHTFEVDVFHGENEGLIVAEIELDHKNDSFDRPEWLDIEVTEDNRYHNAQLVRNPYKRWKKC